MIQGSPKSQFLDRNSGGAFSAPTGFDEHYPMSQVFLIALVCYAPLINSLLPTTHFGSGIPDLDLVTLLFLLLVPVFTFELLISKQIKTNAWLFIVFGYFSIVLASVSWSPWYRYDVSTVRDIVVTCGFPVLIATLGVNLFHNRNFLYSYLRHLVFSATFQALVCIGQFLRNVSLPVDSLRAAGTLGNPNLVAIFLVLSLSALLFLKHQQRFSSKFPLLAQGIIFAGLLCTISRKGLITAAVVYFLFYFFYRQYQRVLMVLAVVALSSLLVFLFSHTVAARFTTQELESQFGGKWEMMMAGVDIFEKNPIIGLGYKGYYESFGNYFPNPWVKKYDAHNEYATALANFGTVGFSFFLLIFILPLLQAKRLLKNTNSPWEEALPDYRRAIGVFALTSIIPFMMSAFYAGALFYQNVVVFVLYLNISILYATGSIREREN